MPIQDLVAQLPGNLSPTIPLPSSIDYLPYLWLSFSVHEYLNAQLDLLECRCLPSEALVDLVMPDTEILEFDFCRHTFPYVAKKLYPSSRPEGIPGQYLHLTQIPIDTEIVESTGLSRTY